MKCGLARCWVDSCKVKVTQRRSLSMENPFKLAQMRKTQVVVEILHISQTQSKGIHPRKGTFHNRASIKNKVLGILETNFFFFFCIVSYTMLWSRNGHRYLYFQREMIYAPESEPSSPACCPGAFTKGSTGLWSTGLSHF